MNKSPAWQSHTQGMSIMRRTYDTPWIVATLVLLISSMGWALAQSDDWHTVNHQPGMCAMTGVCGKRKDGDPLNCPSNAPANPPDPALAQALAQTCPSLWAQQGAEQGTYCCTSDQVANIASSTQRVVPFVVGCPACLHNFVQLWCVLACSPNQATFSDVVAVQPAPNNNATVVSEINHWVDAAYGTALYDSCKDVKFGSANVPAMMFIGGGAKNAQQWFDFLGLVKDKRFPPIGSPFQINFLPGNSTPPDMAALATTTDMVSCGDLAFRCSCGDCPSGPGCDTGEDDGGDDDNKGCHVGVMSCWDFSLIWVYLAGVALVLVTFGWGSLVHRLRTRHKGVTDDRIGPTLQPLLYGAGDTVTDIPPAKAGSPEPLPSYEVGTQGDRNPLQDERVRYYWLEHVMQVAYYELGKKCAMYPLRVIGMGVVLVGLCALGLLRFHVETAPERLWVGPGSQAAQDAAAYEERFGPFYRVAQLILTTTPDTISPYTSASPSQLPSIVALDNLKLIFDMHAAIDAITVDAVGVDGSAVPVSLADVCYKPFGDLCATQSVAQYWHLDRELFDKEQAKPPSSPGRLTLEYCLAHWTTECRSAYGAPVDPALVLGGFPRDNNEFRNYTADTTSFVVTLPLSSKTATRDAALAWEEQFLKLAHETLLPMAQAANLTLAFSAQRSVQDELARESMSDAVTVASSYGFMLLYIALALGALPPSRRQAARVLVLSRVGLGLGGVLIVAGSVVGALGIISLAGLWSTLIIMEVIPFLALAVGVDNMFMLVHALERQDASVPLAERVAGALASVGPSITLAATCEVLAFGLGALSPMPAVRNFSACAAVAVALDFVLQVTVFVSLLALDTRRIEQHRVDLAPCLLIKPAHQPLHAPRAYGGADPMGNDTGAPELQTFGTATPEPWLQALLHRYMHKVHIPLLQRPAVQAAVLITFFTGLVLSLLALPRLSVGLDQAVALPADSYLQPYFRALSTELRVGPPLYLVVRDINTSIAAPDIASVCGVSGCAVNSLANQVSAAARRPRTSYIASGAAVWVDDFMAWLNPGLTKCCRLHAGKTPSPSPSPTPSADPSPSPSPVPPDVPPPDSPPPDSPPPDSPPPDTPPPPVYPSTSLRTQGPAADADTNWPGSQSQRLASRSQLADIIAAGSSSGHVDTRVTGNGARRQQQQAMAVDGWGGMVGADPEAGSFCPAPDQPPCSTDPSSCQDCRTCVTSAWPEGRPDTPDYQRYLDWFLAARPSEACAKGGAGAHSDLIARAGGPDAGPGAPVAGLQETGVVEASAFRTFYTPLNEQHDFIAALRSVKRLVDRLKAELNLDVFAYSVFHVFFEQYLDVWRDAGLLLGAPLAAVGIVSAVMTGSVWGAALLLVVLASLLVHLMGAMWIAGIQLNAVSLVNLAMSLGIAVEFCAHISHAYQVAPGSRAQRVAQALEKSGASVLSGITFTKLVGVAVLAGARTRIFELYYFRLYLALVLLGAAHGLVLLPVLLALMGPPSWSKQQAPR